MSDDPAMGAPSSIGDAGHDLRDQLADFEAAGRRLLHRRGALSGDGPPARSDVPAGTSP